LWSDRRAYDRLAYLIREQSGRREAHDPPHLPRAIRHWVDPSKA
jgi:hypothetical protein